MVLDMANHHIYLNHLTMKARLFLTLTACVVAISCCKKESNTGGSTDSGPYFAKVKTIIQANCLSCHSSSGTWQGKPVAFDNDSSITAQSASIKAVVNDPVTVANRRMPEGSTLSASDIATIVNWYNKGGRTTD